MIAKAVKARSKAYRKTTRSLLRQLRGNGGVVDRRTEALRDRRARVLAKLIQVGKDPGTDACLRKHIMDLVIGSVGVNDQIDAMLAGKS
jgi:hypothetical protein